MLGCVGRVPGENDAPRPNPDYYPNPEPDITPADPNWTLRMGVGLERVSHARPVPVPTKPIPGYLRGFPDLCYALLLIEFPCCSGIKLINL